MRACKLAHQHSDNMSGFRIHTQHAWQWMGSTTWTLQLKTWGARQLSGSVTIVHVSDIFWHVLYMVIKHRWLQKSKGNHCCLMNGYCAHRGEPSCYSLVLWMRSSHKRCSERTWDSSSCKLLLFKLVIFLPDYRNILVPWKWPSVQNVVRVVWGLEN